MRKLDYKRATFAAIIVWILGVLAYTTSYFITFLDNPEKQANLILVLSLIPFTLMGARFYYLKGNKVSGLKLGLYMFLITILLDACFTVPLLIVPFGGSYQSFFGDIQFWGIGLEYVLIITTYWIVITRREIIYN